MNSIARRTEELHRLDCNCCCINGKLPSLHASQTSNMLLPCMSVKMLNSLFVFFRAQVFPWKFAKSNWKFVCISEYQTRHLRKMSKKLRSGHHCWQHSFW